MITEIRPEINFARGWQPAHQGRIRSFFATPGAQKVFRQLQGSNIVYTPIIIAPPSVGTTGANSLNYVPPQVKEQAARKWGMIFPEQGILMGFNPETLDYPEEEREAITVHELEHVYVNNKFPEAAHFNAQKADFPEISRLIEAFVDYHLLRIQIRELGTSEAFTLAQNYFRLSMLDFAQRRLPPQEFVNTGMFLYLLSCAFRFSGNDELTASLIARCDDTPEPYPQIWKHLLAGFDKTPAFQEILKQEGLPSIHALQAIARQIYPELFSFGMQRWPIDPSIL